MGFLDGAKQDLIEFIGQGQQFVMIDFYDEWDFVRVPASHAAEHAERRGDPVTATFNRQLHDIVRVEVLRIRRERSAGRVLDALIDQAALAIERVYLVEDVDRAKRTIETDRLRSALLTSISHDLKTPLAAVLAAASTLRDLGTALTDAEKAELLATIIDESERLNRFIANLLDMTKLESGAIVPNTATMTTASQ